ncbi:MAG: tyrosine-type recombinase/integrase [Planctomycetota bacterium]
MVFWMLAQKAPEDDTPSIWPISESREMARHHISAFLGYRQQSPGRKKGAKISNATINKEIRYIRLFVKYMSEDKLGFGLPTEWQPPKISKVKDPIRLPRWLDERELDRYFRSTGFARRTVVPGVPAPQSWQALLLLGFTTAMRRRALFGVPRPSDAQLKRRELRLPAELDKSGVERIFPLSELACEVIARLPGLPGEPMFRWDGDYRSMYHELESMQTRAGIPPEQQNRLHVLRSSGATHMLKEGAPLSTVQRHLGHSTPQITERYYLGLLTDLQRSAVDNMYVPLSQLLTPQLLPPLPQLPDQQPPDDYPQCVSSD